MKYFATRFLNDLTRVGGRKWVKRDEEHWFICSLDETAYRKWLVEPFLEGTREGLIDGIHVDWEGYGGRGEAGTCYCDECFRDFPGFKKAGEGLPGKLKRFAWLGVA